MAEMIENIDIGGPSMIRSAAKKLSRCPDRYRSTGLYIRLGSLKGTAG